MTDVLVSSGPASMVQWRLIGFDDFLADYAMRISYFLRDPDLFRHNVAMAAEISSRTKTS